MKYVHVRSVNGTSYSGDYTLLSFREKKDLSLEDLAGPVKMMAIPQHGSQKKINKSIQLRTKIIETVYTSSL